MTEQQVAALVAEAKPLLGITWEDETTEARLYEYVRSSVAYINEKLGAEADYSAPGTPRDLLFERCRYLRDGAADVFEHNYLPMILAMQHGRQVAAFVAEE